MKMRIWLPIILAVAALTSACTNTMRGAGQDIDLRLTHEVHGGNVAVDAVAPLSR